MLKLLPIFSKVPNYKRLNQFPNLKTGDIVAVVFLRPRVPVYPKSIPYFKLQLQWNLLNGYRRTPFNLVTRSRSSIRTLRQLHTKKEIWRCNSVIGQINYLALYGRHSMYVKLQSRFRKVFLTSVFFLNSPNIVGVFLIKPTGRLIRHKSLNYALRRFNCQRVRLFPLRRMHKKK